MIKQLTNDLFYIGVMDYDLRVFDVVMETKFGSSYNAFLIKTENHNLLIDTVKAPFFDEYLANLQSLVDVKDIDCIIVDHTEPDHAGSIQRLLEMNPNIEIIGSKAAILYLGDITNREFKNHIVKPNEEITFDTKTFRFISAPFLHWPDSIYTYIVEDEILFTCDSFGAHYAYEGLLLSSLPIAKECDYLEAFRYYYDSIFVPYKKFVLQAIDKIKAMPLRFICTGHGPILDKEIPYFIDLYKKWSESVKQYDKLIVMPYATSYGYTEEMGQWIERGIKAYDESITVLPYRLDVSNYDRMKAEVMREIDQADAILFGSTTINKDATPVIWDLAATLNPVVHQGKYATVFGSYGWSGEGVTSIHDRLKSAGFKVLPFIKLKFKPSSRDEETLMNYGKELAGAIFNKEAIQLVNSNKISMKE